MNIFSFSIYFISPLLDTDCKQDFEARVNHLLRHFPCLYPALLSTGYLGILKNLWEVILETVNWESISSNQLNTESVCFYTLKKNENKMIKYRAISETGTSVWFDEIRTNIWNEFKPIC